MRMREEFVRGVCEIYTSQNKGGRLHETTANLRARSYMRVHMNNID